MKKFFILIIVLVVLAFVIFHKKDNPLQGDRSQDIVCGGFSSEEESFIMLEKTIEFSFKKEDVYCKDGSLIVPLYVSEECGQTATIKDREITFSGIECLEIPQQPDIIF